MELKRSNEQSEWSQNVPHIKPVGPMYLGSNMSHESTCVLYYERRLYRPTGDGERNDA